MFGYWRNNESPRKEIAEEAEHTWVAGKETGSTLRAGRAQPSSGRDSAVLTVIGVWSHERGGGQTVK